LHRWGEIWHGEASFTPMFTPSVQRVAPAGRKKTQNQPLLSNLNNRRFALRAMLSVKNIAAVFFRTRNSDLNAVQQLY